jgi:hypothetical protein
MFVSILFFLIPSKSRLHGLIVIISIIFPHGKSKRPHEQILPASAIGDLHWDVILLLGAGFAIGDGFSKGFKPLLVGVCRFDVFRRSHELDWNETAIASSGSFSYSGGDFGAVHVVFHRSLFECCVGCHFASDLRLFGHVVGGKSVAFHGSCDHFLLFGILSSGRNSSKRIGGKKRTNKRAKILFVCA